MKSKAEQDSYFLDQYFSHIELSDSQLSPFSLQDLTTIIEHHLIKFSYQNFELYAAGKIPAENRIIPTLKKMDLLNHMICNKGGYCFQQQELLFGVLDAIGFKVNKYLAKTILQPYAKLDPANQVATKTHELLIVDLNDTHYLIDTGMGGQNLRVPLELKEGEQFIGSDEYQLLKTEDLWTLNTRTRKNDDWFCLYQFLNVALLTEDIYKAHEDLWLTHQFTPIRDEKLVYGQTTPEKRKSVVWFYSKDQGFFKSIKSNSDAEAKTRQFTNFDNLREFAKTKFNL